MSIPKLVVWESQSREPIVARVALAGDFLPAGRLDPIPHEVWEDAGAEIAPYFEDVGTSFVNLECAIQTEGLAARKLTGLGAIVSAPATALDYLTAIRSAAVGFANNHAYDFGAAGVERTRGAVADRNMVLLGARGSATEAPDVYIWQGPRNIRVGLWAAAKASHDLARGRRPGVEPATPRRAKQALEGMKCRGAQLSIALFHAGAIRASRPDPADVRLMDAIAESGFDIVAASHSHRISGSKCVGAGRGRHSFCFYGLGSLVSAYAEGPIEREGLIVVAGISAEGRLASVELRPVLLAPSGFGQIPQEQEARTILDRFQQLSSEIADGSFRKPFYREVSQSILRLYFRDAGAAFRASGLRGLGRKAGRVRLRHLRRLAHGLLR